MRIFLPPNHPLGGGYDLRQRIPDLLVGCTARGTSFVWTPGPSPEAGLYSFLESDLERLSARVRADRRVDMRQRGHVYQKVVWRRLHTVPYVCWLTYGCGAAAPLQGSRGR